MPRYMIPEVEHVRLNGQWVMNDNRCACCNTPVRIGDAKVGATKKCTRCKRTMRLVMDEPDDLGRCRSWDEATTEAAT